MFFALCQQALVGIAYSFGFIIGPVIGAVFAKRSSLESGNPYLLPALFAITLTVADISFVYFCLKETLPKEKRVILEYLLNYSVTCIANKQFIIPFFF